MKIKNLFLATIIVASPYVLPYPGVMPGNRLYKIKTIYDGAYKLWIFGNFANHKYELNLADKKLVEAKVLFEYQQYPLALAALEKSNYHFQQALAYLIKAQKQGKNISEKHVQLQAAAEKHRQVLEQFSKSLPDEFLWQPEKAQASKLNLKSALQEAIKAREI